MVFEVCLCCGFLRWFVFIRFGRLSIVFMECWWSLWDFEVVLVIEVMEVYGCFDGVFWRDGSYFECEVGLREYWYGNLFVFWGCGGWFENFCFNRIDSLLRVVWCWIRDLVCVIFVLLYLLYFWVFCGGFYYVLI